MTARLLHTFIGLSFVCAALPVLAQEAAQEQAGPATEGPPQLQPVFSDDFRTDTRGDYEIEGDVAWEPGKLTLSEGESIERSIKGGPWAKVELKLGEMDPPEDSDPTELRIWFLLDGATNCFVRLRSLNADADGRAGSVSLFDIGEEDGQPIARLVREQPLTHKEVRNLTVQYRHGLVELTTAEHPLLTAHIENGAAAVARCGIQSPSRSLGLTAVSASAIDTPAELTAEQQTQAAEAHAANSELIAEYKEGNFAEAARIGERVLKIRMSALGEHHPDYAESLNNLASMYDRMGDYARAESLQKQCVETEKSVLGEQHPHYAMSLINLAHLYINMADYAHAEPLCKQALDITKSVLGEQHPDYAQSLNILASLYESMGNYARAEPLYKQALDIRKSVLGEQHPDYATSLNNLGLLYVRMGNYARAEPLYKQALDIRKSVQGEQHPDYTASLNNLADLYGRMGDIARAELLLNRSLEIERSLLGEQHPDYATSLNNLAGLYYDMGDSARAESLLKQSLAIYKSVLGEQHPAYARSVNNLAGLHHSMGEYARAEILFRQSLAIYKSLLGEQHPAYARSLSNLARLHHSTGDHARAEALYRQASDIRKSVLGEQHPDYAQNLNDLAALYRSMADYVRAEPLYKQALDIQRASLDRSSLVQSARQQDRNQVSLRFYLDSWLATALTLEPLSTEPLEDLWQWKGAVTTRQQAYRQVAANPQLAPLFANLQSISRQLSALTGQTPVPPAETASDAKKTAFEQKRKVWNDRFATLSRQREDLEQQIAAGSEEFRRIREPLTVAEVRQWLPAGTAFVDFLEYRHATPNAEQNGKTDFERRYIAFVVRRDQEPAMIGLGSAASLATAITAFRRPFLAEEDTIENRRVAEKAGQQIRRDLWLPIEAYLDGVDTVIVSPDTALGTLPFGALPGKQDGSYLLEDYRIAMLPMANLLPAMLEEKPTESGNGLLLVGDVDYNAETSAAPSTTDPPLLLADARGLRGGQGQWGSLTGFREELEAVGSQYQQAFGDTAPVLSLTGRDATERTFLENAAQFSTLHVITHGYFEDPTVKSISQAEVQPDATGSQSKGPDPFFNTYLPGLLSGLVMAGANKPSQDPDDPRDGILRASEIEAASMQGVDLVVLSACETGLGAVAGGEGLTGLQRAFHIAGARTVIASLWEVDDDATLTLMTEFYTNLWEKKISRLDALREAQLSMLRGYDPKSGQLTRGLGGNKVKVDPNRKPNPKTSTTRLDPRYWAAFQLSGDWR